MPPLATFIEPQGYATLTFSGKLDALRDAVRDAVRDAMEQLRTSGRVHCVVLSTTGPGASTPLSAEGEDWRWLERFELPTIFVFEDELSGTALDIALACDIRICGAAASIRSRKPGSRRLLQLIGADASLEFIGLRGVATPDVALGWGLVSEMTPPGEATKRAAELAATIASRGPIATKLAKEAISRGLEMPLEQALRFETDLTLLLQTTKDRAEGVRAFIEKRPPRFTGE
ncbi:MAG: enoyl-CoA hydratase/isomerase family protein [Tepidiformaceae bacterium]